MPMISGVRRVTAGRVSCRSIGAAVSLLDAELDPEDAAWLPAEIPNDPAAGVGHEGQQEIPELDHAPLETMLRWRKVVALHCHHWRPARNGVVAVGDAKHIAEEVLQRVEQEIPIELPAPLRPLRVSASETCCSSSFWNHQIGFSFCKSGLRDRPSIVCISVILNLKTGRALGLEIQSRSDQMFLCPACGPQV